MNGCLMSMSSIITTLRDSYNEDIHDVSLYDRNIRSVEDTED